MRERSLISARPATMHDSTVMKATPAHELSHRDMSHSVAHNIWERIQITCTRERRCACSRASFSLNPRSKCLCASAGMTSADAHHAPMQRAISNLIGSFPSSLD